METNQTNITMELVRMSQEGHRDAVSDDSDGDSLYDRTIIPNISPNVIQLDDHLSIDMASEEDDVNTIPDSVGSDSDGESTTDSDSLGPDDTTLDPEGYRQHLTSNMTRGAKFLQKELHNLAKANSYRKLEFLCRYLQEQQIPLESDEMLGDKYKETAFHVAVLKQNVRCAKILIESGGSSLVCKPYGSPSYKNVTALHSAITNKDKGMVSLILSSLNSTDKHNLLNCRGYVHHTEGKFNCPWIPLHLAAAMGHMGVFKTLLEHGANLMCRDEDNGNTILHSLAKVSVDYPKESVMMLKEILSKSDRLLRLAANHGRTNGTSQPRAVEEALLKMENYDGFTPFIYAACVGAVEFARAITEVENVYRFMEVDLVPGSYDIFDMSEMDTAVTTVMSGKKKSVDGHKRCARLSAVEVFVYATRERHTHFGKFPAVYQVMKSKWQQYKYWFLGWFIFHLLVMVFFTIGLQYRKLLKDTEEQPMARVILLWFCDVFVLAASVFYIVMELTDLNVVVKKRFFRATSLRKESLSMRLKLTLMGEIHRPLLVIFSLSFILMFILKKAQQHYNLDVLYAIASVSGWCFFLFFTRAFKNIGIFTTMLRKMVLRMLAYFSIVLVICLLGFSCAVYAMYQETAAPPAKIAAIPITFYTMFRVFVSLEEFDISGEARVDWLMKILFIMFVCFFNILLLNMLIAAMNNAYLRLENKKTLMWLKMRTNAVLMIERRIPEKLRPQHNLELYESGNIWFIRSRNYHIH